MRVRRELARGEVVCGRSESEEEELLETEGDIEGRGGSRTESYSVIETGPGRAAVTMDDDVVRCISNL